MFSKEEKEELAGKVRSEARQAGVINNATSCWQFFLHKVQKNFRVFICMSTDPSQLRKSFHSFPSLLSCANVIWFHPWTQSALISVAFQHLRECSDILSINPESQTYSFAQEPMENFAVRKDLRYSKRLDTLTSIDTEESREISKLDVIAQFLAFVFTSVEQCCLDHNQKIGSKIIVTPKKYLDYLIFFPRLLRIKRENLHTSLRRLLKGKERLISTESKVVALRSSLEETHIKVYYNIILLYK